MGANIEVVRVDNISDAFGAGLGSVAGRRASQAASGQTGRR
jgi:hypothetical protein